MDIASISSKARSIDILSPVDDTPTGLKIFLMSLSSPKVKAAQRAIANQRLQSRKNKINADQIDAQSLELICAAVDGWEWGGDSSMGGEKLDFNPANVKKVVSIDWIRKQLDDELGDDAAFFKS